MSEAPFRFGAWLAELRTALAGSGDTDVPCGTCTACCAASQFVLIEPDEREALAAIPAALRFPAPGLPDGHVLLGYDEHGRCAMLGRQGCTIYDVRPRTCRTYDCRVFAATGLSDQLAAEAGKAAIAERAATWRFEAEDAEAQRAWAALRRAAAYLGERPEVFTEAGRVPPPVTGRAVLAVEVAELFLAELYRAETASPSPEEVRVALRARR